MFKLFYEGGPLFMGILTSLLFIVLAIGIYNLILISKKDYKDISETRKKLKYIKSLGLFALVAGFLGQLTGLYQALGMIEEAGDISPGLLAGGLKISMITPLYGMLILLVSYALWLILDLMASRSQ
ncbi:MAG: MotA/TolQ/ExbB proton channel family protein [Bacteroidales bacterium]|nr:MotA/TolQ/ExbB proton channel family protein [Bacteroidales bacterium]